MSSQKHKHEDVSYHGLLCISTVVVVVIVVVKERMVGIPSCKVNSPATAGIFPDAAGLVLLGAKRSAIYIQKSEDIMISSARIDKN